MELFNGDTHQVDDGAIGKAMNFDGNGDYIRGVDSDSLDMPFFIFLFLDKNFLFQ
jgi:hypothetical protein